MYDPRNLRHRWCTMGFGFFANGSVGRLVVRAMFACFAIVAIQCKEEQTPLERGEPCGNPPAADLPCAEGLKCMTTEPGLPKRGDARCVLVVTVGVGDLRDYFPLDKGTLWQCPDDLWCREDPTDARVKCLPPTDGGS